VFFDDRRNRSPQLDRSIAPGHANPRQTMRNRVQSATSSQPEPFKIRRTCRIPVTGDSMIDAAICDGDVVTVRRQDSADHGDIVAALLDDEATVKVLKRQNGQVWLMPRTPPSSPSPATTHASSARSSASCGFSEQKPLGEEPLGHAGWHLPKGRSSAVQSAGLQNRMPQVRVLPPLPDEVGESPAGFTSPASHRSRQS
jgi:hypothetical protein